MSCSQSLSVSLSSLSLSIQIKLPVTGQIGYHTSFLSFLFPVPASMPRFGFLNMPDVQEYGSTCCHLGYPKKHGFSTLKSRVGEMFSLHCILSESGCLL